MRHTLIIMAAGMGSRFGGNKQLARVGPAGETLVEYALFDARRAGFSRAVLIGRPDLDKMFELMTAHVPDDLEIITVHQRKEDVPAAYKDLERTKPWGTAHAVLAARAVVDGPFAVVNADDFYGPRAYELAARASAAAAVSGRAAIIGFRLDHTLSEHGAVTRGIPLVRDRQVVSLDEVREVKRTEQGITGMTAQGRKTFSGSEIASMNCWVFPRTVITQLAAAFSAFLEAHGKKSDSEAPLPELIHELVRAGRLGVDVIEAPGPWFGLTHADDRPQVVDALKALADQDVYPNPLWGNP